MIYLQLFEEHQKDLSGEYTNSSEFIISNKLEDQFISTYGMYDREEYFDMDEYIRGIGNDSEVIAEFLPSEYRMRYDKSGDYFIITKNKKTKIDISIKINHYDKYDNDIEFVFLNSNIISEYEPRIVALVDNKAVGGVKAKVINNEYHFDVVVLDEYQGYGISKLLITELIKDAKSMFVDNITAEIVNDMLGDYLQRIGFEISGETHFKVAKMDL